jgi:ketosteroid isomerase-like protein
MLREKESIVRKLFGASTVLILVGVLAISCGRKSDDYSPEKIIALERTALDRWGNGDPKGYLELYAVEVTYFDPSREKRVDGLEAMTQLLNPITGKVKIDRTEMLNPKVQRYGDIATLSYNLVNYRKQPDGAERVLNKWNNTEVFRKIDGAWKIIHSHWSFTIPVLKDAPPAQ